MAFDAKNTDEILRLEKRQIKRRRRKAYEIPAIQNEEPDYLNDDPTGLALSGGGIRSAAFCLGFIQSMYRTGRMKAFDYMSSVSGGGYSAAYFSSQVVDRERVNWDRDGKRDRLPLETDADGSQSESVIRLGRHGRQMGNFLIFFSRHFWGLLVNVGFVVTALIALASIMSYIMRVPWSQSVSSTVSELGFNSDLSIPFFFAFLAFLLWSASHAVDKTCRLLGKQIFPFTRYTYLGLILTLVLGVLTLMAIGDYGLVVESAVADASLKERLNASFSWLGTAVTAFFAATLIPYLSPKRLLNSAAPEAGRTKNMIFHVTSNAMVFGFPLMLFFFLAHENISGEALGRQDSDKLTPSHLLHVDEWITTLERQRDDNNIPSRQLLAGNLLKAIHFEPEAADQTTVLRGNGSQVLARYNTLQDQRKRNRESLYLPQRWAQYVGSWGGENAFTERLTSRAERAAIKKQFADHISDQCLSDADLFTSIFEKQAYLQKPSNPLSLTETLYRSGINRLSQQNDVVSAVEALAGYQSQFPSLAIHRPKSVPHKDNTRDVFWSAVDFVLPANSKHTVSELLKFLKSEDLKDEDGKLSIKLAELAGLVKHDGTSTSGQNAVDGTENTDDPEYLAKSGAADGSATDGVTANAGKSERRIARRNETNGEATDVEKSPSLASSTESAPAKVNPLPSNVPQFERFDRFKRQAINSLEKIEPQVRIHNWTLLHAMYPKYIASRDTVYARIVNEADQTFRLQIAGTSFLLFLGIGLLTNLNTTSLHGFYRDQIASIWIGQSNLNLHELKTCDRGAPYHLINGTVNRMGSRNDPDIEGRSRFTFSQLFCGTRRLGYRSTNEYEDGDIKLADAVAVSGGAVTTMASKNFLQMLVIFLTNFRLGQWVRNPQQNMMDPYWPSPIRALGGLLFYPEQRSYLFISDGGHLDNSGLSPLLERRCRLMVCVDGSADSNYQFTDIRRVLHAARAKYGITSKALNLGPEGGERENRDALSALRPDKEGFSSEHFVILELEYPPREPDEQATKAYLVVCKLSLTGDEPIELVEMSRSKEGYPHDPTSDQFLPPDVFDAYLSLGAHIGNQVDQLFSSGRLGDLELPLCWGGNGDDDQPSDGQTAGTQSPSPAAQSETAASALVDDTIEDLLHQAAELEKQTLDSESVEVCRQLMKRWLIECLTDQAAANDTNATDTLMMLVNWISEHAAPAGIAFRRPICEVAIHAAEQYGDQLRETPEWKSLFVDVLLLCGERVKGSKQALKSLATLRPAERRERSEGESAPG